MTNKYLTENIQEPVDFPDEFLGALGAWQRGSGEVQARREHLAATLIEYCSRLPLECRTVDGACYRKRFIYGKEVAAIFLRDSLDEGVASWTLDLSFAEQLKGLVRPDAVTAAIFKHQAAPVEVIVNIRALWATAGFEKRVIAYAAGGGANADALMNFKALQSEVALRTPLRGSEIVALSGVSSSFDDLFDRAGIEGSLREAAVQYLLAKSGFPGEPRYIAPDTVQRVIAKVVADMRAQRDRLMGDDSGRP